MLINTYMENVLQNISMHYEYRVGAKKQFDFTSQKGHASVKYHSISCLR